MVKLNQSETQFNRQKDFEFMSDRKHQNAARFWVEQIARDKCWSKEGFLNEMKKRGFLKTSQDKQIVLEVLKKMKFGTKGEFKEKKQPDINKLNKTFKDPDVFPEEKQMEKYNPF